MGSRARVERAPRPAQAGATTVTDRFSIWLTDNDLDADELKAYDVDGDGDLETFSPLHSLELVYRVSRSRSIWLSALDHLLLTIGFGTCAFLQRGTGRTFSPKWGCLTVLCAIFAFGGAVAGIGRGMEFADWRLLRPISGIYFLSVTSVLLPIWLFWLAHQLGNLDGADYSVYAKAREVSAYGAAAAGGGERAGPVGAEMSAMSGHGIA